MKNVLMVLIFNLIILVLNAKYGNITHMITMANKYVNLVIVVLKIVDNVLITTNVTNVIKVTWKVLIQLPVYLVHKKLQIVWNVSVKNALNAKKDIILMKMTIVVQNVNHGNTLII